MIVADHDGGSAGKSSLPLYRYKIPLIVYAPGFVRPRKISRLASQIDVIPTILSLMGWRYTSRFFGEDILASDYRERTFVGNYQKLGYYRDGRLVVLSPDGGAREYRVVRNTLGSTEYRPLRSLERDRIGEAVAYYQGASYMYKHGYDRWIKENDDRFCR